MPPSPFLLSTHAYSLMLSGCTDGKFGSKLANFCGFDFLERIVGLIFIFLFAPHFFFCKIRSPVNPVLFHVLMGSFVGTRARNSTSSVWYFIIVIIWVDFVEGQ